MEEVLSLARDAIGEHLVARIRADFTDRCDNRQLLPPGELGTLLRAHGMCPTNQELEFTIREADAALRPDSSVNIIESANPEATAKKSSMDAAARLSSGSALSQFYGVSLPHVLNLAIMLHAKAPQRLNPKELSQAFAIYDNDDQVVADSKDGKGITRVRDDAEISVACFRNMLLNVGDKFSEHEVEVLLQECKDRGLYDPREGTIKYAALVEVMVSQVKEQGG